MKIDEFTAKTKIDLLMFKAKYIVEYEHDPKSMDLDEAQWFEFFQLYVEENIV